MALNPKPIIFSPQAYKDLDHIQNEILSEWGDNVLQKFNKDFKEFLFLISYHPRVFGWYVRSRNIRKHVVYKYNMVLYRASKTTIEIITIVDARQSPKSIRKKLK